ncbi:MAG: Zn-dependent exopeptidase M28 [Clostridiales Family XIII bacterium]|jgi:hypothetical protein|nr:Zn-dependent exopeptidase M28 [Clostridiales Family XIII bacterium]
MEKLLDMVKELSFVRVGGSDGERHAAELIQREIDIAVTESNSAWIKTEWMPFAIPSASVEESFVKVNGEEIPSAPYLRSGNIDRRCRLLYLNQATEIDFAGLGDLGDTAVLLNRIEEDGAYQRLIEHRAAAFLTWKGKYYFTREESSLYPKLLKEDFLRVGSVPGFEITAADANRLIQDEVSHVDLKLEQSDDERESRNVLAVIEGTDLKNEAIVLTAHYDSVPVGTGSWDNATGVVALLSIFGHFAANRPRRTLRFVWCGSEELGLLGSKAYVAQNEALLDGIKFCFNFDMCGTALGGNDIFVTGEKELETFVDQYCKVASYAAKKYCHIQSSDSAHFCDRGIPALGLSRGTMAAEIHTIHDLSPILNESAIRKNVAFAVKIIGDVANAAVIPVKKGMSPEHRKELDKYFHKEEDPENAKEDL